MHVIYPPIRLHLFDELIYFCDVAKRNGRFQNSIMVFINSAIDRRDGQLHIRNHRRKNGQRRALVGCSNGNIGIITLFCASCNLLRSGQKTILFYPF